MEANNKNKILKQIKSNNIFKKLRSKYILQTLFNKLEKNKIFEIIRYNKNLQKRLNITIIDYKDFSEQIEIEIITVKCKYDIFINIKEEDKKYYHIYFNNNKKDIKRNYLNEDENIEKINIIIDNQITSFEKLFFYCTCIESICFKKFYSSMDVHH